MTEPTTTKTGVEPRSAPRAADDPPTELPGNIREKLRREAERAAAVDQQGTPPSPVSKGLGTLLARAREHAPDMSLASSAGRLRAAVARARPALGRGGLRHLRKVQLTPEVRDGLIDRGRRAGVNIGTTIDKIIREMPDARTRTRTPNRADPDADVSTVAVQRAVRRPSILAPGHILTALLAGGVIHIVTTFAITALGTGSAYRQLRPVLPANELVVLPPLAPGAQVLPYLAPDMLYGICRFDLSQGAVEMSALLPEAGWSFALYTRQGDNFYATPGQKLKPTQIAFVLAPASDRLVNLTPGVRKTDVEVSQVTSPDQEGLMVVRAPLKGVAFEAAAQAELKRAKCSPVRR
jgi:uncharacterized membrane protein